MGQKNMSNSLILDRTLKNSPDGTFLLRQESAAQEHFVLSFVLNQKVYHVNVERNEEDHLELGGVAISITTIHDMIAHFKRLPFYNNVTLFDAPKITTHKENDEPHACQTCAVFLIGEDLNLADILWQSTQINISMKKMVEIGWPEPNGKTKYVSLLTTDMEITFAYENPGEREKLDLMLGKLVSPIYGKMIQVG